MTLNSQSFKPAAILLTAALLSAASASAAPRTNSSRTRAQAFAREANAPSTVRFGFSPALGIWNGNLGVGGNAQIQFRLADSTPVYLGFQTGFQHFSRSGADVIAEVAQLGYNVQEASQGVNSIPLLATFMYRVEPANSVVRPYFGVGVGVAINSSSLSANGQDVASDFDPRLNIGTSVAFQAIGRPGVEFQLSQPIALFIEPAAGVSDGAFLFQGSAGLNVDL